jgi:hypothetical protein
MRIMRNFIILSQIKEIKNDFQLRSIQLDKITGIKIHTKKRSRNK